MNNYNPENQRLYFDDLINARELGGMPLKDGKKFNYNVAIRCGSPSIASHKAYELLIEHGIGTVIDLRSEAELSHYGNPFMNDGITDFHNISLFVGDPDSDEDPTMEFLRTHKLGDFYVIMVEELGSRIVEILKIILNSKKPVLFHCAHGKDRTGVIAAILYLLAGASDEDIILNYKVSYEYAKSFLEPLVKARCDEMKHTLRSDAVNMEIFLDYINSTYSGNIENYLLKHGMNQITINNLKNKIAD